MSKSSMSRRSESSTAPFRLTRRLPAARDTADLGRELALFARPGDWILLFGDLGAGKSALARAVIRALAPGHGDFEVPSPTFTLIQPYDFTRIPVAHADLYRIGDPAEVDELGLEEMARTHVLLVEWPGRLPETPAGRLEVHLDYDGEGRIATLAGFGRWADTLRRMEQIRVFLDTACGGKRLTRQYLQGDASSRRYERITCEGAPEAILMDMPERPDGPPIENGRSYDEIAGLSRHIRAVEAINATLRAKGYCAPQTLSFDPDAGLMLQEFLAGEVFGRCYEKGNMQAPLRAAVELLADVARRNWPARVTLPNGSVHVLRAYDQAAMEIEVRLLTGWFWPHFTGAPIPAVALADYLRIWRDLLPHARRSPPVWVLRDFHSPNLIWRPAEEGFARIGLVDVQDAVMGPAAYDLASLLQDARFPIPEKMESAMLEHYIGLRRERERDFDARQFELDYLLMGTQRACKVLGIFTRLNDRDGKPAYLSRIPHVADYLRRNLTDPRLSALAQWFARHLPLVLEPGGLKELVP